MAASEQELLARWSGSIRDAACSPLEFYDLVEQEILESGLAGVNFSQFTRREGGLFSPLRIYFRIRYDRLYFDLCAFVSGHSFVVSYWLHVERFGMVDLLEEIPGVGFLIETTLRPATYYSIDVIEHFQHEVHNAVMHVIDELSENDGAASLPPEARQPIWEQIW
ncbi:MAG: hypothetical protein IPL32_03920 [Chloracidobacterium sp.]|nr:hypothetical protein [Chloracidobacterium sp.]